MNHKKRTNSKSKNEAVVDFRMFAGGSTGKIGTAKLVLVSAELRAGSTPSQNDGSSKPWWHTSLKPNSVFHLFRVAFCSSDNVFSDQSWSEAARMTKSA